MHDRYDTAPADQPPPPYHPVDIADITTAGPVTPFVPSPNAPVVHPALIVTPPEAQDDPAEITADLGPARFFSSSWPHVEPPPQELEQFSPTVRDLSPNLSPDYTTFGQPARSTIPFPEEWPETWGGRMRQVAAGAMHGAVQWGVEVVRRTTNPPSHPPSNPHTDPRISPRQRAMNRALFGGRVTEEEAQNLQADIIAFQLAHEEKALRRYFHAPHEPLKDHCRFCGEASGMVRCRRPGLPHDALIWLCFECQKHTIASNETDARRKGCGLQIALERDFLSRLGILTDLPVMTYDDFLNSRPGVPIQADRAVRRNTLR
jgi:hypothetical protein